MGEWKIPFWVPFVGWTLWISVVGPDLPGYVALLAREHTKRLPPTNALAVFAFECSRQHPRGSNLPRYLSLPGSGQAPHLSGPGSNIICLLSWSQTSPSFWIGFALVRSVGYYQRFREREQTASRLEAQLVQARLQALQMQLNPHFLFNTLNCVSSLMRSDPDGADEMLERLSSLLRITLAKGQAQQIPLQEEMEVIQLYVSIQQLRFGDRVRHSIEVAPEAWDALVPTMILQPIVENAYVHGIARSLGRRNDHHQGFHRRRYTVHIDSQCGLCSRLIRRCPERAGRRHRECKGSFGVALWKPAKLLYPGDGSRRCNGRLPASPGDRQESKQ